jgi:REP element-mobilizing transposase RayT
MHSKLPHINLKGYYQFVTFRTYDSVDEFVKKLQITNEPQKILQYKMDQYLDSSQNGTYLNNEVIDIFMDIILDRDEDLYDMEILCVMPNHIHMLFKQNVDLEKIMHYIKGSSATQINRYLNKDGKFWADGYFDKAIRDEEHFVKVYNYIKNNPLKVGLSDNRVFSKYE